MAIRVSVFYPAGNGKRFDHAYHANTHVPMAARLLEPVHYEVDRGLGGGVPGSAAPFVPLIQVSEIVPVAGTGGRGGA